MRPSIGLVLTLLATSVWASAPEVDWFTRMYTRDGVELRNDERVFDLFAVLNLAGFDESEFIRLEPVPRRKFHPFRAALRDRFQDAETRKQAETFFDAHPVSVDRYLAFALGLSGDLQGGRGELKGFERVLQLGRTNGKLGQSFAEAQGPGRDILRNYLKPLDASLPRLRRLLKVSDAGPSWALVANVLDAPGVARAARTEGEWVVTVGPASKPSVRAVLAAFAGLAVDGALDKKLSQWGGGEGLLREAQAVGATERTVRAYATALLAQGAALKATDASDAEYDQAAARGYFGLRDIGKLLEEARSVDEWILEALNRAEARRPARK